jgi:hypothetical protein
MVRFIHLRIRVQAWVAHNAIDEVVDYHRDGIHAAKPIVQGLGASRATP